MAQNISLVRAIDSTEYVLRITLDHLKQDTLNEIMTAVPKLVAEQYAKDHMQEIMERVSVTEIASCIATAVAAKVAESYKPTDA